MSESEFKLPTNVPELVKAAKAAIDARKFELAGTKEEVQQSLVKAKLEQAKAEQKLRDIEQAEQAAKKEAAELELQRKAEEAEKKAAAERLVKAESEWQARIAVKKAAQAKVLAEEQAAKAQKIAEEKITEHINASGQPFPPVSAPAEAKWVEEESEDIIRAKQMQAIQEIAKARGDKVTFGSAEDLDAENMDAISPFSLLALSPQGACEQYQKVRLNTIRHMMSSINRRLAKNVASSNVIKIKERKVRPDSTIDILCLFTDEMRQDMMELYRQKGWKVNLKGDNSKKYSYVFEPQSQKG